MGFEILSCLRMHSSLLLKTFVGHLQGSSVDIECAQGETQCLMTFAMQQQIFFPDRQHVNVNPIKPFSGCHISFLFLSQRD